MSDEVLNKARIDSVRAEFEVNEWLGTLEDEGLRQHQSALSLSTAIDENAFVVHKLVCEVATLRAKLERLTSDEVVETAAWYVVRVAPGTADHGTRLGSWFTEEEADCWIDEHHVKCALYTHPAITAARDAARGEG